MARYSPDEKLQAILDEARNDKTKSKYRLIEVVLSTEKDLVLELTRETKAERWYDAGTTYEAEDEYDIEKVLVERSGGPSYIFYRLDDADGSNKWLYVVWIPDLASVTNRMLYSAAKEYMKKAFGEGNIFTTATAHEMDDVRNISFSQIRRLGKAV